MFLIWELTEVTQVFCFLLDNQSWSLNFLIPFLSSALETEKGVCLKALVMVPLAPLTVTSLALKSTSTEKIRIWRVERSDTSGGDGEFFFGKNVFHVLASLIN